MPGGSGWFSRSLCPRRCPVSFRFRKLVEKILRQVEESPEVLEDTLNQFVMSATMTVKTELLNEDFLCFLKDYMIQKFLERPKNRKILSSLFIFISSPTVRSKLKDNFADVHQLIFKTLEKLYDPHEEFPLLKTFLKPDLIDSDFSVYMPLLKRMSIYISGEQKSLSKLHPSAFRGPKGGSLSVFLFQVFQVEFPSSSSKPQECERTRSALISTVLEPPPRSRPSSSSK